MLVNFYQPQKAYNNNPLTSVVHECVRMSVQSDHIMKSATIVVAWTPPAPKLYLVKCYQTRNIRCGYHTDRNHTRMCSYKCAEPSRCEISKGGSHKDSRSLNLIPGKIGKILPNFTNFTSIFKCL